MSLNDADCWGEEVAAAAQAALAKVRAPLR